ncbi:MAG: retropepsin-like aspartic protease [Cyanobacteria bacterium J06627_28]
MAWSRFSYRFILLPSFAGLFCLGCSAISNRIEATSASDESQAATTAIDPAANASEDPNIAIRPDEIQAAEQAAAEQAGEQAREQAREQAAAASLAHYNEGINLASSADALSQSAFSPDDWGLIVSRWQRAAQQMGQVAPGTANYEEAQAKSANYTQRAEAAQAQIAELQTITYVPLPASARRTAPPAATSQPAATSSSSDDSQQRVRVPIVRRLHGTPVVRVTFNGVREYEMILDTGASRTLITRPMADDLGVVTIDRMIASTASAAEVTFEVGQLSSMSLGGITLNDARVSIGETVDVGLLGNDFFRGYDVNIMSSEGVVELVAN